MLFLSWKSIFEHNGQLTPGVSVYSFRGENVLTSPKWGSKLAWLGAKGPLGGTSHSLHHGTHNCRGWASNSPQATGIASDLESGKLLNQQRVSCNNQLVVLCIETFH